MSKRLTHEYVASRFEAEGYTLLQEYTHSKDKLKSMCPQGHVHLTSWNNWTRGRGCKLCNILDQTFTHEYVASQFEAEGYTLLQEYTHSKNKHSVKCSKGHEFSISWDNFRKGTRCPTCNQKGRYSDKYFLKNPEDYNRPAYLYYITFEHNSELYSKIGITVNWESRQSKLPPLKSFKVIEKSLGDAFKIEQRFIRKYENHRCINNGIILPFTGYTECFLTTFI